MEHCCKQLLQQRQKTSALGDIVMATFTWSAGRSDDWKTISDWTPTTDAPPGAMAAHEDHAVFNNTQTGRPTTYTVSVATGEIFDLGTISLSTAHGRHDVPTISISGDLLTSELAYSGRHATAITINAGGLFDIRTAISDRQTTPQTITIAADNGGAVGSGGNLEFGSTTVDNPNVTYSFLNRAPTSLNTGEIEFLTGFTPGVTTTQHISNIARGDEFVFANADFTGDNVSLSKDGVLTVTNADDATVITMTNISMASGATPAFRAYGDTIEASAPCYVAGTCILTPLGEVPIEDLAIGDLVITRSGKAEPIKWIGRRSYQGRFISGNHEVLPIRIGAGALADSIPKRDLYVSPRHAMLIGDVLVPAEKLVNGITIRQLDTVDTVEYIHLELQAHDIIFAEGAPSETFVDCDSRGIFNNANQFSELYPNFETPKWAYCAPWIDCGEVLARLRQKLDERLGSLGFTKSFDPAVHLLVDGRETFPDVIQGCTYLFRLTKPPTEVRIKSRTSVPASIIASDDRRQLGVNLSLLILRNEFVTIMVEHTHPALVEGYHKAEATHRWTDGDARMPPEFLACLGKGLIIELRLMSQTLPYRIDSQARPEPEYNTPDVTLEAPISFASVAGSLG